MQSTFKTDLKDGLRDTIPITLGYFAVALLLGIIGKQVGLTAFQGFLSSYFTLSSTGGFAAFLLIGDNAPYVEMAIMMLVVNARYLLMGASLTQRLDPAAPFWHRLLIAQGITDEIFGVSVARKDFVRLPYSLAVIIPASIGWAGGTAGGILMGSIFPQRVVMALGVALYGMFLAIFIPPARKNKVIAGLVVLSFALSFVCTKVAPFSKLSSGNRIILLTVLLAGLAALLFPVSDDEPEPSLKDEVVGHA